MIDWKVYAPLLPKVTLTCGFCGATIRATDDYGAIGLDGVKRTLIGCAACTLRLEEQKQAARDAQIAKDAEQASADAAQAQPTVATNGRTSG